MRGLLACLAAVLFATEASAIEPVLNPENGHYYARVDTSDLRQQDRTWDAARAGAESLTFDGMTGYLATITSQAEQDFLTQQFPDPSPFEHGEWIGASDSAVEGEWRWVTGPEAGELFWLGAADGQAIGFQAWLIQEPNDFGFGEDFALFNYFSPGAWNDQPQDLSSVDGFLVEFSRPVPEPSSIVLAFGGAMALSAALIRRSRATTQTWA